MRILHVFIFASRAAGGGTTDLVIRLARAQAARGHEVSFYTSDHRLEPGDLKALEGVRVRAFRCWLKCGFYVMPGMVRACRSELPRFDVIHLHLYRSFQNMVVHRFASRYGVPFVMDAHGSLRRFVRKPRVKALFDRVVGHRLLRDAVRCIGETDMGVREYIELDVAPEKVVRIAPPFPVEDYADLPERGLFRGRFDLNGKPLVMFLGRIHWIKGIDILTESFAQLAQRRSDVQLVIVGPDDGYRAHLEALTDRLGIRDRVLFTGFLAGREKLSALVDADIVVQTSRYEQGAWAPIEAVLCGTPIIVSDNSGSGEDVRRMNAGYLVRFGDREDLCRQIEYVLSHPAEALAKTLTAKAYVEQNLSMAHCVRQYEELYKTCIEEANTVHRGSRS